MLSEKKVVDNGAVNSLQIYTFGQFTIKRGGKVLSENSKRSSKPWELLKYLLTQREKRVLPETILDALWPEQEYSDPKRAVRTMVSRLRQILDSAKTCEEDSSHISLAQGCYKWNNSLDYWLDAEAFEALCYQAHQLSRDNLEEAIETYHEALSLYKGDYLPESSYYEWVLPVRNYYSRIYLRSVLEMAELLKKKQDHNRIIKITENALLIEPYEEEFHLRFMEALLETGKPKQALAHYEYVTTSFYRDLGVKPSPALRNLYRMMKNDVDNFQLDLSSIQDSFKDREEAQGAFFCDSDLFRLFYQMERRRSERTGQSVFLGLQSFVPADKTVALASLIPDMMEKLRQTIQGSLRLGDIFCRWNESQFLLMLPGLTQDKAEMVLKRIEERFWHHHGEGRFEGITLYSRVQKLLPMGVGGPL